MPLAKTRQYAFTLVELAIVLVIIGLIVGGVLVGRDLIRASELQAVIKQEQQFVTGANTFRLKYKGLPGDIQNASDYWGLADPVSTACIVTAPTSATDLRTCNGNGNGIIEYSAYMIENFRFWQQLANAGLIPGTFDGLTHGANNFSTTTVNSPVSRLGTNSLWSVRGFGSLSGASWAFDGYYGNTITFGFFLVDNDPANPIMTGAEAASIDDKVDDGKPGSGKLMIRLSTGSWITQVCTDATASNQGTTANYLKTNTNKGCALEFTQVF